jgi:hypothetical protein
MVILLPASGYASDVRTRQGSRVQSVCVSDANLGQSLRSCLGERSPDQGVPRLDTRLQQSGTGLLCRVQPIGYPSGQAHPERCLRFSGFWPIAEHHGFSAGTARFLTLTRAGIANGAAGVKNCSRAWRSSAPRLIRRRGPTCALVRDRRFVQSDRKGWRHVLVLMPGIARARSNGHDGAFPA